MVIAMVMVMGAEGEGFHCIGPNARPDPSGRSIRCTVGVGVGHFAFFFREEEENMWF